MRTLDEQHQIRRIDSYVQLSWRLKRITKEQYECSYGGIYIGVSGRINYLPSKQTNKERNPMTTSYAHSVVHGTAVP